MMLVAVALEDQRIAHQQVDAAKASDADLRSHLNPTTVEPQPDSGFRP